MPILVSILILAALLLLVLYICVQLCFRVHSSGIDEPREHLPKGRQYTEIKDRIFELVDKSAALPYEDVYIQSFDGLRLHAKFYAAGKKAPTHILMHGYRSSALLDFSGAISDAVNEGHNVLLVDQRAHAGSEGKYLSFGIFESRDCLSWIEYINRRLGADSPIILKGVSMGGATVLMAAALPLPENVVGILSDCGYSSPEKIIRHVMKMRRYPQILFPLLRLGGRIFCGFDVCSLTPLEALKSCKVPLFVIHGDDDRFVPYAMAREILDACPTRKFLFTGSGAGHGLSYILDRPGYMKVYKEFINTIV